LDDSRLEKLRLIVAILVIVTTKHVVVQVLEQKIYEKMQLRIMLVQFLKQQEIVHEQNLKFQINLFKFALAIIILYLFNCKFSDPMKVRRF
jgi:hypothetical protein